MGFPKSDVQTTIFFSKKYDESQRKRIGNKMIDIIIKRTQKGKDKNGMSFAHYEKDYAKEKGTSVSNVDLTLTEDMLTEMEVVESSIPGQVIIGYDMGNPEAGKASGNNTGKYGQSSPIPGKKREFIGINNKEKALAIAQAEQSFGGGGYDEAKSQFLDNFTKKIFREQGNLGKWGIRKKEEDE